MKLNPAPVEFNILQRVETQEIKWLVLLNLSNLGFLFRVYVFVVLCLLFFW